VSDTESRWYRWAPVELGLYVLFRALVMIVGMFPYSASAWLGRLLGVVARTFGRKHPRLAAMNLERTKFTRDIPGMVRRVYDHLGRNAIELLMLPRLIRRRTLARQVVIENTSTVDRLRAERRGAILVIAHLGNWELTGLATAHAGYPIRSLARPFENRYINRWLLRTRTLTGQEIIVKYGALAAMRGVLRRGEMLVIQADQDARREGVVVNFFGRPASTVRSPALLALRHSVPLIPVDVYRDADGVHHVVFTEAIDAERYRGRTDAVKALTQAFTSRLEEFVRRHPDQWLWTHRRWKSVDPGQMVEKPVAEEAATR
jgi:KDO2-lipid IV(A) lauroyltransferase